MRSMHMTCCSTGVMVVVVMAMAAVWTMDMFMAMVMAVIMPTVRAVHMFMPVIVAAVRPMNMPRMVMVVVMILLLCKDQRSLILRKHACIKKAALYTAADFGVCRWQVRQAILFC